MVKGWNGGVKLHSNRLPNRSYLQFGAQFSKKKIFCSQCNTISYNLIIPLSPFKALSKGYTLVYVHQRWSRFRLCSRLSFQTQFGFHCLFFIFINHVCVTVKIWFLPLASFLCYLITLRMCINHVVRETVTPRRYAGCTEWLSSEFGDIESRWVVHKESSYIIILEYNDWTS